MSYEEEAEIASSVFRCVDPIQNLRIRVVLKPVKNRFTPLPYAPADKSEKVDENEGSSDGCEGCEERTFAWQEKVFSKSEIERFSVLDNCKTKLHEKYHDDVTKMQCKTSSEGNAKKLFTYVDVDNYKMTDESINLVHGDESYISILARRIDNMEPSGSSLRNYKNVSKKKIVNHSPSDAFKKETHLINGACQKMFIMADLGSIDREEVKKSKKVAGREHVLCTLTYDPVRKVLAMTPSFSSEVDAKPYSVGTNGPYSKGSHRYWLHHASSDISNEDVDVEKRIVNKILRHQSELRLLQTGNDFRSLSPNHINVSLLGEIRTARNFEYDRLCVIYVVNVPEGWHSPSPEALTGTTQTTRSNAEGIAHLCCLFDVDLICDLKCLEEPSARQPEIYFEVLSVDRWNVYRNEGYAFAALPRSPGIHDVSLACWRPTADSVKEKLERFFVGGSQVLEDVAYVGTGTARDDRRVSSRFGLRTVPSGSLDVRLSVMHQSEAFKIQERKSKMAADRTTFARLDTGTLLGSVNAVLEAFRQAREKMLRAKESLEATA